MIEWPFIERLGFVMRWDTWAAIVILGQLWGAVLIGLLLGLFASRYLEPK